MPGEQYLVARGADAHGAFRVVSEKTARGGRTKSPIRWPGHDRCWHVALCGGGEPPQMSADDSRWPERTRQHAPYRSARTKKQGEDISKNT